ncbi:hypothetical protein BDN72DRAFT_896143 [Pluteus cervinus]|uniref:Uncharacterized protein n=1 Tax=Pluteus cervinus TaxID=181527 RepID=A0ACD3AXU0_9AGAR|nr:hypothetical protein BDN72DRAFT_896143 [Pluteus cervinus]
MNSVIRLSAAELGHEALSGAFGVKITILFARQLFDNHRFTKSSHYIKLTVGKSVFYTRVSQSAHWTESFTFLYRSEVQYFFEVFCKHGGDTPGDVGIEEKNITLRKKDHVIGVSAHSNLTATFQAILLQGLGGQTNLTVPLRAANYDSEGIKAMLVDPSSPVIRKMGDLCYRVELIPGWAPGGESGIPRQAPSLLPAVANSFPSQIKTEGEGSRNSWKDTLKDLDHDEIMQSLLGQSGGDEDEGLKVIPPRWVSIMGALHAVAKAGTGIGELSSSAKLAIGAICAALEVIIKQVARDERIECLVETITGVYMHLQETKYDNVDIINAFAHTLQRLVKLTTECVYFIVAYRQKAFMRRAVEGALTDVNSIIADFEAQFLHMKAEFVMGSVLQGTHATLVVLEKAKNIETLLYLKELPLIEHAEWRRIQTGAHLNANGTDLILDGLTIWAQKLDKRTLSLLVPRSQDGRDASLIAHQLSERFYHQSRLGCSIILSDYFQTANSSQSSTNSKLGSAIRGFDCRCRHLVSTIARDLAALHPAFAEHIALSLARTPKLATAQMERQFEELFLRPLQELTLMGPILIVIDGLDESLYKFWNTEEREDFGDGKVAGGGARWFSDGKNIFTDARTYFSVEYVVD